MSNQQNFPKDQNITVYKSYFKNIYSTLKESGRHLWTEQVIVLPRHTYSSFHPNSLQPLLQNIELQLHTLRLGVLQLNFRKPNQKHKKLAT